MGRPKGSKNTKLHKWSEEEKEYLKLKLFQLMYRFYYVSCFLVYKTNVSLK